MDDFYLNSKDLSNFFSTISEGKKKRKKELEESVGDSIDDFFSAISIGKKVEQEKKESLVGDSFDYFLNSLAEEIAPKPKKIVKKKKQKTKEIVVENTTIEEIKEEIKEEEKEQTIPEKIVSSLSEGNFVSPPSTVTKDPLTPLDQNYKKLSDLEKNFKLFTTRIQQQLSTLGGGGETNLTYMDVPITSVTTSTYTIKPQDYYIGVNYAGAVTITLPRADREGKIFVVKDELGEASKGTNRHITIFPSATDLIDGRNRAILAYDYGSLTFIWKGNSWRII